MSPEFARELEHRRRRVFDALGQDSMIVFSEPVYPRNGDVEHPYRPSSDLVYLTGFEEPQAVALFRPNEPRFVLFVRPRDKEREIWDGRRAGVEGAKARFGADEAHSIEELNDKLPNYLENVHRLHHFWGTRAPWDEAVFSAIRSVRGRRRKAVSAPTELVDASVILHRQRQLKSDWELEQMRRVATLTAEAHNEAMFVCRPGLNEFDLQTTIETRFRRGGARGVAYESIVGSGANGTILHYRENSKQLEDGELVLIDAGAEREFYAADITRTFPVSGRFSEPQRRLYEVVLHAQEAAIERCVPGRTLNDVHDAAFEVVERGLIELGLVPPSVLQASETDRKNATARFFMHRTSHFLGMDVHDVGPYRNDDGPVPLEPRMVITVEPGIYVAADDETVPEEYRGIGIRIEDDVAISDGPAEVLTGAAAKQVAEVEAACRGTTRG